MNRPARRVGMTLIELLAVVTVIALLAALLIPAVQSAREAARRVQCSNNLKQMGLALHQYAESQGTFPGGYLPNQGLIRQSYLMPLLPYLEQRALYDSYNANFVPPRGIPFSDPNNTVRRAELAVLLCPLESTWRSDPDEVFAQNKPTNYAANCGSDYSDGDGVFIARSLGPRDITDGLSQTSGVSEWIIGQGIDSTTPLRNPGMQADRLGSTWTLYDPIAVNDVEKLYVACESINSTRGVLQTGYKGSPWVDGGFAATQYNHKMPPNTPSCRYSALTEGQLSSAAAITAGSRHHGGAFTLLMDGGVRFVKSSVQRRIWASMGTRNGGEVNTATLP